MTTDNPSLVSKQDTGKSKNLVLYLEEYNPPFLPLVAFLPFLLPFFWKYRVEVVRTTMSEDFSYDKVVENRTETMEGASTLEKVQMMKNLTFGYNHGWTQKTVSNLDIEEMTILKENIHGLSQWGGWGIRYRLYPVEQWGYIATNGPGIRVRIRDQLTNTSRVYVFNCQDPQRVYQLMMMGDSVGDSNPLPNTEMT
jgi:hypothetical protein